MLRVIAMDNEELHSRLAKVEFIRLSCNFGCEREVEVSLPECLALRPLIMQSARDLADMGALGEVTFARLFDPHFGGDTEGRKRFQKPAPPFVFRYQPDSFRVYQTGESFSFELVLMGTAITQVPFFIRLLRLLAERFAVEGTFELIEVSGWDDSENLHPVWLPEDDFDELMPPVCTADWWVMRHEKLSTPLTMEFLVPARLMVRGKPLFRPNYRDLFPFLLRRVTSLCYAHANQLLVEDVQPLLLVADKVVSQCEMRWEDWRTLKRVQDLEVGGLLGRCELSGEGMEDLIWVMVLAELFQVGRGAAYGAGKIELFRA